MYGSGILKTLWMTIHRFLMTYVDDFKMGFGKRYSPENLAERQGPMGKGAFTVQYPQERLPLPERSRNLPFFVIDAEKDRIRCTACGVCAQICPTQCIWIERAKDPETGRPFRYPEKYHIDISTCMGCGFCAEFCPFDAIKMDHDFELSSYTRPGIMSMDDLSKPEAYDKELHPSDYADKPSE